MIEFYLHHANILVEPLKNIPAIGGLVNLETILETACQTLIGRLLLDRLRPGISAIVGLIPTT